MVYVGFSMVMSMLGPVLVQFDVTQEQVGLIFMIPATFFLLTSTITSIIIRRIKHQVILILLGNISMLILFMFVGPMSVLPLQPNLKLTLLSLGFMGFGEAIITITSFVAIQHSAHKCGFPCNLQTCNFLSASWSSCMYAGSFIGASFGGALVENLGFREATSIFSLFYVATTLLNVMTIIHDHISQSANTELGRRYTHIP